ncbi:GIY-YIG nuclease family protein [Streptosporangium jomthongense]|uniref:GIY-YIG nuclease family protein n=1 Tax=Streptosporangium jomthongense TaxID=1193683 RepID=A0ABV8FFU3_9ACTN
MKWKCRNCLGARAFIDFSQDDPQFACLDCDWGKALDEDRCTEPCQEWGRHGAGTRCSGAAVVGGRCWRHIKADVLHREIYRYFRNYASDDGLPRLHHVIFAEALKNAAVVIADERHGAHLRNTAVERRVNPERGPSLVYFVGREGLIKIGTTTNLEKRLKALSKGSAMPSGMSVGPVELLATEPGDHRTEGVLHSRFASTRVGRTEWFRPSKALQSYIDDLKRYQQNEDHFMRRIGVA